MTILYIDIKKRCGDFFLDIQLESQEEILALLGPSGCGKSMTLKCIAGIETPDEGHIVLNNRILFDSKKNINLLPQDRKVGLLFQNYALFPNMTLEKNISIGIPKGCNNKKEIIKEIVRSFSLEGLENNYPNQLSGGQQQRVALARMLVNQPKLLMLDEPFSALDEYLRWQMEQEIINVLKNHKGSTLYVSHNKDEVYRMCDKIAILNNGQVAEINYKEDLFNKPKTINSAILIGCRNISQIKRISSTKVYAIDWGLEISCNKVGDNIKYIGIHTQVIKLSHNNTDLNRFKVTILDIIENLHSSTLVFKFNNESSNSSYSYIYMKSTKEEIINNNLIVGKSIYVSFDIGEILFLY